MTEDESGGPAPAGDDQAPKRVGLDPQPMVDWLSPTELLRAGVKAVLAATFGNYADKREVQAALSPGRADVSRDYSNARELWFDYVADIGDGFNPTYAVTWLLAQRALTVHPSPDAAAGTRSRHRGANDDSTPGSTLPAGKFLVLGGDQVYPTATREEYRRRLVDPCTVAFRTVRGAAADDAPDLFALPGNHDWYDGLTSFIRLFCQRRTLGQLRTFQQRSYFAIRLPNDWWLWGIDVQLEADIDEPQKQYFRETLENMKQVSEGRVQRLILCTGVPSWVHCGSGERHGDTLPTDADKYTTLSYFERLISDAGVHLALALAGDFHHYAHYAPDLESHPHRITAGGGGAYFYPTHHLPERLTVPVGSNDQLWRRSKAPQGAGYRLASVYPEPDVSRGRSGGVLRLPKTNRTFTYFIGGLYLLIAWIIQSASKAANGAFSFLTPEPDSPLHAALSKPNTSLMDLLAVLDIDRLKDVATAFWHVMRHSPASVSFAAIVVFSLWKYRAADRLRGQIWGAVHGVLHVILCMALIWIFSIVNLRWSSWWWWQRLDVDSVWQVCLFTIEMLAGGGIAGGILFGAYLLVSARLGGVHLNDVYSSQRIEDYKNFVRIHIRPDGSLDVYPIAIPKVPGDDGWQVRNETDLVPSAGRIETHLIGGAPIRIAGPAGRESVVRP
jgi:hypothetical protein